MSDLLDATVTSVIFALIFILLVLATARMSRAYTIDTVAQGLRDRVERKLQAARVKNARTLIIWWLLDSWARCYWCSSFWAAALAAAPIVTACTILMHAPWQLGLLAYPFVWFATAYAAGWVMDHEG